MIILITFLITKFVRNLQDITLFLHMITSSVLCARLISSEDVDKYYFGFLIMT